METMRYQENKKSGKWPIIAFVLFVIVGGALIYLGIANENNPQIVGSVREEVQSLVDIYAEETIAKVEEEKISIEDIDFKVKDKTYSNSENKNFKANMVLPRVYVSDEELTQINEDIYSKYIKLFNSLKDEMEDMENSFTFKTSYKYYDNVIGDKRILSITVHQRILDDKEGTTTTDKVETYNIDLEKKEIITEANIATMIFGKEYKTIIKNEIKDYVVENNMIKEEEYVYALTGMENYYIKEGVFHIIFNEGELVDKKYKVVDIEIENTKEVEDDKEIKDTKKESNKNTKNKEEE